MQLNMSLDKGSLETAPTPSTTPWKPLLGNQHALKPLNINWNTSYKSASLQLAGGVLTPDGHSDTSAATRERRNATDPSMITQIPEDMVKAYRIPLLAHTSSRPWPREHEPGSPRSQCGHNEHLTIKQQLQQVVL